MEEKRKAKRLKAVNEVTLSLISDEKNLPKEKVFHNYCRDITESGARIQSGILLPVDTQLKMDFTLDALHKKITAVGKVKWIKIIIDDACYEAGVEFVNTPKEAIRKLNDYLSWKQKNTSVNPFGLPLWIFAKVNEPESESLNQNNDREQT